MSGLSARKNSKNVTSVNDDIQIMKLEKFSSQKRNTSFTDHFSYTNAYDTASFFVVVLKTKLQKRLDTEGNMHCALSFLRFKSNDYVKKKQQHSFHS